MRALKPLLLATVVLPTLYTGAHAALGIPGPTQLILDLVGKITGGAVTATGVSGWHNALPVARLELRDAEGRRRLAQRAACRPPRVAGCRAGMAVAPRRDARLAAQFVGDQESRHRQG